MHVAKREHMERKRTRCRASILYFAGVLELLCHECFEASIVRVRVSWEGRRLGDDQSCVSALRGDAGSRWEEYR